MAYTMRFGDDTIVSNLRRRWKTELERFSDVELAGEYADFSLSDYYGNNDERFLEWIFMTDG